ncbi:MAG: D-alanine--D-alanine ligase [Clostridia bacterium]|nr:D-alanine--D-alanine ligase [Clostridia bacterium]
MYIVVLYGGSSPERQVSLCSGHRVCEALTKKGHHVHPFDLREVTYDPELIGLCQAADAVFLALHGGAGEDGTLQQLLEQEGIFHYTGSAPQGAALAMHKQRAKERVAAVGVPVATGALCVPDTTLPPLPMPFVLKPISGGSSVGLCEVHTSKEWEACRVTEVFLCEEYLCGREYTVGILEGHALPVVEICPRGGRYDYAHKYGKDATEEICPAHLSDRESAHLQRLALTAFSALEMRDFGRVDFREDRNGSPKFLEANALPGMTATSLFPLAAATDGLPFDELCDMMAATAAKRKMT